MTMTSEHINAYTRTNPVYVSIKKRYTLCGPASDKQTSHLVFDLIEVDFPYSVGDSIGVYAPNDHEIVEKTLEAMRCTGEENIIIRRTEEAMSFRDYLIKKASITDFSRKFVTDIKDRQTNPQKKRMLEEILEDKVAIKAYISNREVWDLLLEHPEVTFTPQEYSDVLMPNLPRLYSIASSKLAYPNEVHLTISLTEYETNGHRRYGVCSHYLCNLAPIGEREIPIYLHPHTGFTLPLDQNADIIMVGPGTGVAPFKAFMEERAFLKAPGNSWLFFGERTEKNEFFYKDFFKNLEIERRLKLTTAFSRDQKEKIYVQHRMLENAEEIFRWLEKGAYFYVCGDKDNMARDVDTTLHQIIQEQGGLSENEAKLYLKNMRLQKRYLRDVY